MILSVVADIASAGRAAVGVIFCTCAFDASLIFSISIGERFSIE